MRKELNLNIVKEPLLYKIPQVAKILHISETGVFELFKLGLLKAHNDSPRHKPMRKGYSVVVSSLKAYRRNLFQPDFIFHFLQNPFEGRRLPWSDPSRSSGGYFPGFTMPQRITRLKRTVHVRILGEVDNYIFVRHVDVLLRDAAEILSVDPSQIHRMIKENKLSGIKFGKHDKYIPYDQLIGYVEKYTLSEEECLNLP